MSSNWPLNKGALEKLYVIDGLSERAIANKFGVVCSAVHYQLVKHKIQRRRHGCPPGPKHPGWKGGIIRREGYILVMRKGHARADKRGYVKNSILVWEEAHGNQPFPEGMEPHHKNEVKDDDRPENIEPKTHEVHTRDHKRRQT